MRSPPDRNPDDRHPGWPLAGYLLVFALGVVVGTYASPIRVGYPGAEPAVEARAASGGHPTPSRRQVAEVSGAGDRSEGPFDLLEGAAFISIQFEGHHTCRVRLVNERGEATTPLDSPSGFVGGQFGPWKARAVAHIPSSGRYFVEVSGEGDWKVMVTQ